MYKQADNVIKMYKQADNVDDWVQLLSYWTMKRFSKRALIGDQIATTSMCS